MNIKNRSTYPKMYRPLEYAMYKNRIDYRIPSISDYLDKTIKF